MEKIKATLHGEEINAQFDLTISAAGVEVTMHARGGGAKSNRNPGYKYLLETILGRLAALNGKLEVAQVVSRRAMKLPRSERLLDLPYPIDLSKVSDMSRFGQKICQLQRPIASEPSPGRKSSGAQNRKLQLGFRIPSITGLNEDEVKNYIIRGTIIRNSNSRARETGEIESDGRKGSGEMLLGKYVVKSGSPSSKQREASATNSEAYDAAWGSHNALTNKLEAYLSSYSIAADEGKGGDLKPDLQWDCDEFLNIAEIKSTNRDNEESQLRTGLGQVLRYRHAVRNSKKPVRAVLVIANQPTDAEWIGVCKQSGVELVWPEIFDKLF